jgi:hypothetical protein
MSTITHSRLLLRCVAFIPNIAHVRKLFGRGCKWCQKIISESFCILALAAPLCLEVGPVLPSRGYYLRIWYRIFQLILFVLTLKHVVLDKIPSFHSLFSCLFNYLRNFLLFFSAFNFCISFVIATLSLVPSLLLLR